MDVAFASSTGEFVDQQFQSSPLYSVWHVCADEARYAYTIPANNLSGDRDGKITRRAEALKQCALVCSQNISGPAAAKLAVRNIHHLKTGTAVSVAELLSRLQAVLRERPAPWLCKADACPAG